MPGLAPAGLYLNRQVLHVQDLILIARSNSNPGPAHVGIYLNRQVLTCRTLLQKAGPARAGLYFNRQVLHMQDFS